jgi:hypothetical protein
MRRRPARRASLYALAFVLVGCDGTGEPHALTAILRGVEHTASIMG